MRILKKIRKDTNDTTEEKFFGGYLTNEIHEFIALYTEAHGITKTDVLREMAGEWLKQTRDDTSVPDLMDGLIFQIQKQIEQLKKSKNYDISEIKIRLKKELLRKGINSKIVENIILNIKKR